MMKYDLRVSSGITIAIPTYNRVEKLMLRISELIKQMSNDDILLISDNHTIGFDREKLGIFKDDHRVVFYKNEVNIGANANIVKCFERATSDWMWLMSDDDIVFPDALSKIRAYIIEGKTDFVNFSSSLLKKRRNNDILCSNFNEYIDNLDHFGNQLLMSNNLYNMKVFRKYLKFAYWGCFVNAPHIAPIFLALEDNTRIILSSQSVVEWQKPDINKSWCISSLYNVLFLPDVLSSPSSRVKAIKAIIAGLPVPEYLIAQLCFNKLNSPSTHEKENSFAYRIMDIYIRDGYGLLKYRGLLLKAMIHFPKIYLILLDAACKFLKRKSIKLILQRSPFQFYI